MENKFTTYWEGEKINNLKSLIKKFEIENNYILPKLYKKFKFKFNNTSICQNCFNFISKRIEKDIIFIKFLEFGSKEEVSEPIEQEQKHLNDPLYYGVPGLVAFASTAEGDTLCFDYRDNPKTSEPKVILLVHDEYEETNGVEHMKIEPIANSFNEFLDMLYEYKDEEE